MAMIVALAFMLSSSISAVGADLAKTSPIGKVVELLSSLEVKVIQEGENEAEVFRDFLQWCSKASKNLNFEIKTYTSAKEKQEAKIAELASNIEIATSKIEDLSATIAKSEAELKEAVGIRLEESTNFESSEKELVESSDTLSRALSIISVEISKNPAALAQIDKTSMASLMQSLHLVVEAAAFSSADQKKLVALVQASEDDDELSAPASATYSSQSSGIVDVLQDLKDKAEEELGDARKTEAKSQHNFAMMKKSLEDQMSADTKDLNDEKAAVADAEDGKAKLEGDLAILVPDLKDDEASLEASRHDCMQSAADHEATMGARKEELKTIQEAKTILEPQAALLFLQLATASGATVQTRADLAHSEIIAMVKKLAHEQHSSALAQLASRIAVVSKYGTQHGANPYEKIKVLISEMIGKLQKQSEAEATEKSFCNEQIAKTEAKKEELDFDVAARAAKIDQAVARSAELKSMSKVLHEDIVSASKNVAELHALRSKEHANYLTAKGDLERSMASVQKALGLLRDYYGTADEEASDSAALLEQPVQPQHHAKATGAGTNIIHILEVCESDVANGLSKEESEETDAETEYQEVVQEEKVAKAAHEAHLNYNNQEMVSLGKSISEFTSDKQNLDSELSAVLQYYARVKERCVARPDTYEGRATRREAELNGLNEALSILESEASFIQKGRRMRGGVIASR